MHGLCCIFGADYVHMLSSVLLSLCTFASHLPCPPPLPSFAPTPHHHPSPPSPDIVLVTHVCFVTAWICKLHNSSLCACTCQCQRLSTMHTHITQMPQPLYRLWKGLVPLWGRQIPYTMMKFGEPPSLSLLHVAQNRNWCSACQRAVVLTTLICIASAAQHHILS